MVSSLSILLCGSGSGGHVSPLVAVAQALRAQEPSCRITIVTGPREEETALVRSAGMMPVVLRSPRVPHSVIAVLLFPFRVIAALMQAGIILSRTRPNVVFAKGGVASGPLCLLAWLRRIPVVIHESDSVISVGGSLLGKIARVLCTGFPTGQMPKWAERKAVQTGNPVRRDIPEGNRLAAQRITGFSGRRPVLMVIGGSQGSVALNTWLERYFDRLIDRADILHITGAGKGIGRTHARYFARPYVLAEIVHLYALADVIVTRAGATVLSELSVLKKAAVVVPLSGVGHDHQVRNADILRTAAAAIVVREEDGEDILRETLSLLQDPARRAMLGDHLCRYFPSGAAERIATIILDGVQGERIQSRPASPSPHA